jgi:allantoicase
VFSERDRKRLLDLAFVKNGGAVVEESDRHYGAGSNLLLPGRGKDVGDDLSCPFHMDHCPKY